MFSQNFEFLFGELFSFNKIVAGVLGVQNELVELCLDCDGVPVLRVLQNEHHEEGEHGRCSVDHQLLGVAVSENWAAQSPDYAAQRRDNERQRVPSGPGSPAREVRKILIHAHSFNATHALGAGSTH